MRAAPLLAAPLLALAVPLVAGAAPPPGATNCSGCHAAGTGLPAINGRDAGELSATLEAYRSGALPSTLMGRLAKGLSLDEIHAIAAWISVQR